MVGLLDCLVCLSVCLFVCCLVGWLVVEEWWLLAFFLCLLACSFLFLFLYVASSVCLGSVVEERRGGAHGKGVALPR